MPRKSGTRRRATMLLMGLGILLFSGYAITLRGRSLEPRKAVHLLGERSLLPGAPAAMRLIAWDLKWDRPLVLSRVDLSLKRLPALAAPLARLNPGRARVHLNVDIPDWPPGPATLRAELDSQLGPLVLETQVFMDPSSKNRLRLIPPERELHGAPVLIQEGVGPEREAISLDDNRPARFVPFPGGGRLSSTHGTKMLIRVVDSSGRPLAGDLQLADEKPRKVGPDGFVEVVVGEGRMPRKLRLAFNGDSGRLTGDLSVGGHPTQLDLAVDRSLVRSGENLGLHLRSLASAQTAYLEAWWSGGWCHTSELELVDGRAAGQLSLPSNISGPLLVRVRGDPFGTGKARREQTVMVGRGSTPSGQQALVRLKRMPADPGFWESVGSLNSEESLVGALLSRVQTVDGPLPELADGSRAEKERVAKRRSDLQRFGLGLSAVVSILAWLVVAWLLLGQLWRMRREPMARKRSWRPALVGLMVVTLALGGGWIWLYWGG